MRSFNDDPAGRKREKDRDNPTKPFANCEKESAAEINHGGAHNLRNYMCREVDEIEGPRWDKMSKGVDGPTSQNAGTFK
jgi:hypothetical protein